jgi:ketosteroid isomerase-like protein
MSDRSQIEKTLREVYVERQRGDVDKIVDRFAPEARFALAGTAALSPVAMRVSGADPLRAALDGLVKTFVVLDHQIVSMTIDGDRAAVHWRARIKSTVTGETIETELCDLVEMKGDRIASFLEFCDTAAGARLMGRAA